MVGEPMRPSGGDNERDAIEARLSGRFRVLGRLPSEQTVAYYEAETDGQRIFVATLPVDCEADPETEAAFICAVFDLEALSGRGLPTIAEHGVEGGVPFVAYEAPLGRPLTEVLAGGPLTSRLLLGIAEGVLEALATAQRHGVIHGELCPDAIVVDTSSDTPHVTLLGAGLVPLIIEAQQRAGARAGIATPMAYRAPELLGGGAPTERSDLYALGAIIHQMVTGDPPEGFESSSHYADLPQLFDVVRRAMARDPARRYDSADTMRVAVDWVEVESERNNAHTQDIPLWMERSMVGNIPVPDLLRQRTAPPPPMPGASVGARLDGLAQPPLPRRDPTGTHMTPRELSDPSIRIVHEPADDDEDLPLWTQALIAAAAIAIVGLAAWLLTG